MRAARSLTRVVLARHGEAAYETSGSGDSGGSLTALGRSQARALGQELRAEGISTVVCSELSRAVQTAEISAGVLGLPVHVRMGLQEYDVGDERGRPYDPGLFEPLMLAWLRGDLEVGIPGGEDGHQVAGRMLLVLDDLARRHRGATVLVVSHGGAILALLGAIARGRPGLPRDGNDMPGCATYSLQHDAGGWRFAGPASRRGGQDGPGEKTS
ncbi:histidine phosphatase family protein [Blastococcus goldschmidtiae]|uniref:Histidine phosphatase family protein n=1 Tax=Blastococcus goldschmidtiae TaxID=3075546 RepID=A0ABU2KAA7_9ACTN|nr:histidine phosphatase family protein [Blastococcus sp. DSM 46792]MDT0277103.1 histidine phosphatase family protein [Blastococcus sp. DSM 46792]